MRKYFLLLLILMVCSCSGDKKPEYVEIPAEELYDSALNNFNNKKYKAAIDDFDELERQHPYSKLVPVGMIKSAYASYRFEKYDDAILTLERFIQIYPGNKYAPYAYYLKAMCYYERIVDVSRDQKMTDLSRDAFNALISRFPDSIYSKDARLKVDFTRSHLAGKEMEIGRYYLFRHNYTASLKRFINVINNYQETAHVSEALYRSVEIYLTIGLDDEALKMASILGHNYPANIWYKRAYDLMELRKKELIKKSEQKALITPEQIEKELPEVSNKDEKDTFLTNPLKVDEVTEIEEIKDTEVIKKAVDE